MNGWKKILAAVLPLVILGSCAAGVFWSRQNYLMVGLKFYPKNAEHLDLREEKLSIAQYESLQAKLPGCEIQWNVPFQGSYYARDNQNLTLSSLTQADVEVLDYFPRLKQVDAEQCRDYESLLALQRRRPEVDVRYSITLGGSSYDPEEQDLVITSIEEEEIPQLQYFENLKNVILSGGMDAGHYGALQDWCRENEVNVQIQIGDARVEEDVQTLTASAVTDAEMNLLQLLPDLTQLHILAPEAKPQNLEAFRVAFPAVAITWEQELYGKRFANTAAEIDLSGIQVTDLADLETKMAYFPQARKLILSDCGLENEALARFREAHREDYKVVWTVQLGKKLTARTDDTTFMPTRERVYYFLDEDSVNLKYCEDMVCIDVGHMAIHNVEFAACMPNLEYLILAHTEVRDISPLANCRKLKFLELDNSTVRDFTPLLQCTALEDLNIGNTYAELEPIAKMTWLKNLWMVGRGGGAYKVTQALTNTKILLSGNATVAGGWRDLPNYFAMRDLLGMHYMTW